MIFKDDTIKCRNRIFMKAGEKMKWNKHIIELTVPEHIDAVQGFLLNHNIDSVEIESNTYMKLNTKEEDWDYYDEAGNSQKNRVVFYLPKNDYGKHYIFDDLIQWAADFNIDIKIKQEEMEEKQWSEEWKKYFRPIKITDNIVVKPEWESYEKKSSNEIVIELDPGMAFGTGSHETTSLCIELLEEYVNEKTKVLDIGCGSGILSIAAAMLNASQVTGIDIDKTALQVAKENVEKNQLSEKVLIKYGDLNKNIELQADIAVANITAEMIMLLSENISKNLQGSKIFILSGILIEKEAKLLDVLRKNKFKILKVKRRGEWSAAAAQFRG